MEPAVYRAMAQAQGEHWWFAARRALLRSVIRRLELPVPARILEIGCGTGANLSMLETFGKVCAVESDDYAIGAARAISAAEIRKGSLPDALPFTGEFDLVCLFDVLEHVEDDGAALVAAAQRARRGGRVLVTVPAYQWLFGPHDRSHGHFRRYTATQLARRIEGTGLRVARLGYFNTLLFPLLAATRLYERWGARPIDQTARPHPLVNRALHQVFTLEAACAGYFFFPFGASIGAVLARD